jgi:hypothetical protein
VVAVSFAQIRKGLFSEKVEVRGTGGVAHDFSFQVF